MFITGISCASDISPHLGDVQVNCIFKIIAIVAELDESVIKVINRHFMLEAAAEDLLSSEASISIMIQRGDGLSQIG